MANMQEYKTYEKLTKWIMKSDMEWGSHNSKSVDNSKYVN